jgi:hypothetical protein
MNTSQLAQNEGNKFDKLISENTNQSTDNDDDDLLIEYDSKMIFMFISKVTIY